MFRTIQTAVQTESLDLLQSLMNDLDIELTEEEYRQLLLDAILFQKYHSLEILVNEALYNPYSSEDLEDNNLTTILQVALDRYDIEAVKILSSGAYGQLTKHEIRTLVKEVVDEISSDESNNFNEHKLKLLTFSSDEDTHKLVRECLMSSKIVDQIPSISWLFDLLRYGPCLSSDICKKAFMEMEKGDWLEAEKTLFKVNQSNNINQPVTVFYPLEESEESWTLLGYAVLKNRMILVKLLLAKGASVDSVCHIDSRQGKDLHVTPLEVAVTNNLYEISSLLLQKLATYRLHDMRNLLQTAVWNENTALLQILLESSSGIENIEEWYEESLKEVRNFEKRTLISRLFRNYIRFGTPKLNRCQEVLMVMFEGTEQEALDEIQGLEDQEIDEVIRFRSCVGRSVQERPAEQIEEGNVHRRDWTLLLYAVKMNQMEIVKKLIKRGADVNRSCAIYIDHHDDEKVRALTVAVDETNLEMCKFLMDNGACIKLTRPEPWFSRNEFKPCSVLPYAFRRQNLSIIQLLIERTDDPGDVFISFCFCVNENIESGIIAKIFSLENMNTLLHGNTLTTTDWMKLVLVCSCCENTSLAMRRCRYLLINILLGYYGFIPKELKEAVETLEERCSISEGIRNNILSQKVINWFHEKAKTFPDLKKMCRLVVRQSCRPCTESSLQTLGLPSELQRFLDHPLKDDLNSEPLSDIEKLSLDDEDDIFCLEIR
ncbi:uncharacterized protein LOC123528773 [Mercenaria mercenaria]|uniref:uncharacterized protein LOC123528773 n=1 Tax=Mercenaria mercenaria TaxID=6596 RepID=UPI00234F5379|nr:uncharacterized protein LOC123528773 [Mercenaria mercenaria]XP_045164694.2 uncharacterized protein LOC123528773 [Mercenaria mercenaria]